MKHTFTHESDYEGQPRFSMMVQTEAEVLEDVLQAFGDYLKGCGYSLNGELGIIDESGNELDNDVVSCVGNEPQQESMEPCPVCHQVGFHKMDCHYEKDETGGDQ
jgi:hypothetical protein